MFGFDQPFRVFWGGGFAFGFNCLKQLSKKSNLIEISWTD